MNLKEQVLLAFKSTGGSWMQARINKSENSAVLQEVLINFPAASVQESIYLCVSGGPRPVCRQCTGEMIFKSLKDGYGGEFCSISCASTFNYARAQDTKLRNNTDGAFGSARHKTAMLEKFGHEFAGQVPAVQEKSRATMLDRYGVEHGVQLTDNDKRKSGTRSEQANHKRVNTNLIKYNVPHAISSVQARDKSAGTNMARYGVSNPMKSPLIRDRHNAIKLSAWIARRVTALENKIKLVSPEAAAANKDSILEWECRACSARFLSNLDDGKTPTCKVCFPSAKIGAGLRSRFLEAVGEIGPYKIDDRTVLAPLELDILYPKHKLAIEINGLYWHGENVSGKKKQEFKKMELGAAAEIRVLNFWEDEIINYPQKVGSLVRAAAGIFKTRLYARELTVKLLTAAECSAFVEQNHMQGARGGSLRLGLVKDDKIYAALVLGASRYSKKHTHELIRFCTMLDTQVVGGFSKLLKFATGKITGSIVSYADLRLFSGGGYSKNGFTFIRNTKPGFCWTDYKNRFNRLKFQKHKLQESSQSAPEIMFNLGYDRLWDCGQAVYELDLTGD